MSASLAGPPSLHTATADVFARALDARDRRFDGLFFVGITTTRIYCRPVCPARVSYKSHRRFFSSAAAAERAGFRPCLRCRPELAPGRALIDAVPRLAHDAARRIAAGELNGRKVVDLARDLGVSERHLRRVLERELGVSALELAQTHRLLLAKQLLADTALSVTRIAYASGFQSLRRFNTAFRAQYRTSPRTLRRVPRDDRLPPLPLEDGSLRLTLSYRPPFAWNELLAFFMRRAIRGVETVEGRRYGRTLTVEGRSGAVFVEDAGDAHVTVDLSPSLVPVLMPLLARLRHHFDLDAEPTVIDAHLVESGLGALVTRRPGLRIPGAVDGFDIAMRALLRGRTARVASVLGEPIALGVPALSHLMPTPERVAESSGERLTALGVPRRRADALLTVARLIVDGSLRLERGSDVAATRRVLAQIPGIGEQTTATIMMRALYWPDAFPGSDRALWRAAGVSSASALLDLAERWRPWRAYAALHLRMGQD